MLHDTSVPVSRSSSSFPGEGVVAVEDREPVHDEAIHLGRGLLRVPGRWRHRAAAEAGDGRHDLEHRARDVESLRRPVEQRRRLALAERRKRLASRGRVRDRRGVERRRRGHGQNVARERVQHHHRATILPEQAHGEPLQGQGERRPQVHPAILRRQELVESTRHRVAAAGARQLDGVGALETRRPVDRRCVPDRVAHCQRRRRRGRASRPPPGGCSRARDRPDRGSGPARRCAPRRGPPHQLATTRARRHGPPASTRIRRPGHRTRAPGPPRWQALARQGPDRATARPASRGAPGAPPKACQPLRPGRGEWPRTAVREGQEQTDHDRVCQQ